MSNKCITTSEMRTILAGERFAARLQPGDIVLLKGELGSGKTHFVKGIARFFDIAPEEVQSPTFSLIHEYVGSVRLYHIDCYRLNKPEDAYEIGLEDYIYSDGISLIEWPEKVEPLLPDNCQIVEISHISKEQRKIIIHHQV